MEQAAEILDKRGNAQRLYKNMLLFIAADETGMAELEAATREYLAWHSIQDEEEPLNLDAQQRRQVRNSLSTANNTVDTRLQEAYRWLITPSQPEPLGPIVLQENGIGGSDNFYNRAAQRLRNDDLLIRQLSPDVLLMELNNYIWGEDRGYEVGLKQLWAYFSQYCYLPRLFDEKVLIEAVRDGVQRLDAPFAYATGVDEAGYHTGVLLRRLGQVYFDDQSLLIHPKHVHEPPPPRTDLTPTPILAERRWNRNRWRRHCHRHREPYLQLTKKTVRYYGRVELDAQRIISEMDPIVEEVIQRLTELAGCDVRVTVEITAQKRDGFDEATVRTVSENGRTLKFDSFEFEEG